MSTNSRLITSYYFKKKPDEEKSSVGKSYEVIDLVDTASTDSDDSINKEEWTKPSEESLDAEETSKPAPEGCTKAQNYLRDDFVETVVAAVTSEQSSSHGQQEESGGSSKNHDQFSNPFARFRCNLSDSAAPPSRPASLQAKRVAIRKDSSSGILSEPPPSKKPRSTEFIKMVDIPTDEQERIVQKWHSLVDAKAPLETRRFQLLVAARLHAQCREATVREAMDRLRHSINLTVERMAHAQAEDFIDAITSLQYYNTKAKHLIQAANEIITQFQGEVPEKEFELRKLTGIGPVLADLLAFVNTRQIHRERSNL